jgi:hypothetical protein
MKKWCSALSVVALMLMLGLTHGTVALGAEGVSTGVSPAGAGEAVESLPGAPQSLAGSFVVFDPTAAGATCFDAGSPATLCFRAESFTNDFEYVYNLWLRFPGDWTVTNAYVQGTPTCDNGTWNAFSWSFLTSPYEVNISHRRYQSTTDHCVAYYCFDVTPGAGTTNAPVSWYWAGDGYGSVPHNPCSDDGYTPTGQNTCDQATLPPASIPVCTGLFLSPDAVAYQGCEGAPQVRTFELRNASGSAGDFDLTYAVPAGNGSLTGPASIAAANGETVSFDVTLLPGVVDAGATVTGTIVAAGNGYDDTSTIVETVMADKWKGIPASAPTWSGAGYPSDGCTARNAAGERVTYLLGDASGTGPDGLWGYNHATNTWFQPAASGTPADRWAPDWAYLESTNRCFLTGGATTPGGGDLNEAYVFDPVGNTFIQLGSFTSVRAFHNSWVGTIDGVEYLCIGGGINSGNTPVPTTQCLDLSQTPPGVWSAENAQLGPLPTDAWGSADGFLDAAGGDQFWYVAGVINGSATVTDEARYWDDADNAWHFAGNTGAARYRTGGTFFEGDFYQMGGDVGGFSYTRTVVRGHFDGATWTWTLSPQMGTARMDNIAAVAYDALWSVDGYGTAPTTHVERLVSCTTCPGDLDNDGAVDPAVYYPANGTWYVKGSGGTNLTKNWGWNATIPVPADYDDDGYNDLAVYYPANGTWYVKGTAGTNLTKNWGWNATIPVPADWDSDGIIDIAVYYPANGTWYVKGSAGTNLTKNWGWAATTPVPGDYDGDGILDLAVYYQSNGNWYIKGSLGTNITRSWGWSAAMPVPADWDGDGITDLAVYYPTNGTWYIRGSLGVNRTVNWGWNAAWPVPADWDGDGEADLAVYYAANGTWYIKGSAGVNRTQNWGWNGADPIFRQYQINKQTGFIR